LWMSSPRPPRPPRIVDVFSPTSALSADV
jgi:hypothetical protein